MCWLPIATTVPACVCGPFLDRGTARVGGLLTSDLPQEEDAHVPRCHTSGVTDMWGV